ncbi:MAG: NADH-quinone oxidoreductase subunit NuoE [Candidatus Kapabacteria bacterium]|nr:NADH-quinone oxidoreductase subunit NuoE [Candidatus Kapabacteria bacterium]
MEFTAEELAEVEKIKAKYPNSDAAIMPLLWKAQKKWGWISDDVIRYLAYLLQMPIARIEGIASFYTMYFKKQPGRHHIQVCTNVSCMLHGGEEMLAKFSDKLGIKSGETTADGAFSLEEVECMGACGYAPMIAVDEEYIENLDINKIDEIIEKYRS